MTQLKLLWNQRSIWEWSFRTFGPSLKIKKVIRANKEMSELMTAIVNDLPDVKIAEEAADVTILMMQICQDCGYDLLELVQEKMDINEKREWKENPDGSHQHVE